VSDNRTETYWTDTLSKMGIVATCQMLHTATHQGDYDYRPEQIKELERTTAVAHLRSKLASWVPSRSPFDGAVRALIVATLNEQEELYPTGAGMLDEASEEPVRSLFVVQNIGWGTHVRLVRAKDNIEARRIANPYGGSDEVKKVFQNGPAEVLFEYEYCPDTGE